MIQATHPGSQHGESRRFVLEMLGFSKAEKEMLLATFRLTGQRPFCYAQAGANERGDVYLVNADNPEGLAQLRLCAPSVHTPAVLIGQQEAALGWPQMKKPVRWMRLFELLDELMRNALAERARRLGFMCERWDGRTYRRALDNRTQPARSAILAPGASAPGVSAPGVSNDAVLIVDDSATVRAFMQRKLAPFRFEMEFANDGETAIRMAQRKKYACIFLDILMPGLDGYQVCKRLKSSAATGGVPVVMLSSKSSAFDRFRGNWAGCDAYLSKQGCEDELYTTIARVLPACGNIVREILARRSGLAARLL